MRPCAGASRTMSPETTCAVRTLDAATEPSALDHRFTCGAASRAPPASTAAAATPATTNTHGRRRGRTIGLSMLEEPAITAARQSKPRTGHGSRDRHAFYRDLEPSDRTFVRLRGRLSS